MSMDEDIATVLRCPGEPVFPMRNIARSVCLIAVLLLTGCTDEDWDRILSYPAPADGGSRPSVAAASSISEAATASCARAARDRSSDVAVQGFTPEIQQSVYDKTYGDCVAYSRKSRNRDGDL